MADLFDVVSDLLKNFLPIQNGVFVASAAQVDIAREASVFVAQHFIVWLVLRET
jgi:hypothetical protein